MTRELTCAALKLFNSQQKERKAFGFLFSFRFQHIIYSLAKKVTNETCFFVLFCFVLYFSCFTLAPPYTGRVFSCPLCGSPFRCKKLFRVFPYFCFFFCFYFFCFFFFLKISCFSFCYSFNTVTT